MTACWFILGVVLTPAQTPEDQARGTEDTVLTALDRASEALTAEPPRPREALRALGPVEQFEPNNPWLWFYRGLAEGSLGNTHTALKALDRAERILTELGDPEPELAEAIETQRRQLRKRVFSLSAQFGLAYDTNVTFRGADLSTLDLITGRHDGVYSTSVGLTFVPIANDRESLAADMRIGQTRRQVSIARQVQQEELGLERQGKRPWRGCLEVLLRPTPGRIAEAASGCL